MSNSAPAPPQLQRELGVLGATMMGLGSIIGTGVFVSIGVAAGIAGPAVILAVIIGAFVATFNALNSAQLAASHPVSGGTYEYGYKYLTPWLGFTAGWMFLVAKTASAATAALGFAGYLQNAIMLRIAVANALPSSRFLVPIALVTVLFLTLIVLSGIKRSNLANIIIVSVTLLSLGFFMLAGLPKVATTGVNNFTPFFKGSISTVLHASALMFVAYTGYGRIATMGEEAKDPRRTIPKAIIVAMAITMLLYTAVAIIAVLAAGADNLGRVTAPLEVAARNFGIPGATEILAVGAMTAMLGVLLNLILGLSRVVLAMGRRGDLPGMLANLDRGGTTPYAAVLVVGIAIASLVLIGDVKTTWSFSAFTVLIYYAITNLAALQLPTQERLYPKYLAWMGLAACLFLAFWVERQIWLTGIGLILIGLIWHFVARSQTRRV
ncbi:APC family permease [Aerosakkonema sp. BLCC-F183]|uniref:APC family permease n=1 Tax=Aerosakkonema sp. BLCC-F183 TaxID=3342834 RepID=UPI0035BA79C7